MSEVTGEEKTNLGPREKKILKIITSLFCAGGSLFYIYTACFGQFTPFMQMTPLIVIALVIAFINYPKKKSRKSWLRFADYFLALLSVVISIYLVMNEKQSTMALAPPSGITLVAGSTLIVLILEATRRVMGLPLVFIVLAFLTYAKYGNYLPGMLNHWGFEVNRIVDYTALSTEGIFGLPIYVCSTIIIFFMIFSAYLQVGGGGELFLKLSQAILGKFRGGPAKMAVVSSCFFGMISGSAVANVVTTGSITIPLMKKMGFHPEKAATVEALASTGGQFMPPVMGAAAFLMAEIIGTSYWNVCVAAFLPALLYFISLFFIVDFEAAKLGIKGLPPEMIPSWKAEVRWGWPLVIPMVILIYYLGYVQVSPMRACLYGTTALVIISVFQRRTRLGPKKIYEGLDSAMRGMTEVTLACACAGIIIGIMYLTNLGVNLGGALVELSRGNMLILLILSAATSLLLGMGMTTSACYLILAIMVAPTLVKFGLPLMSAHLFILYFGCLSAITPPVAPASYAGAALAGSDPMRTGYLATRWGAIAYIVPFFFVYQPSLILVGGVVEIIQAMLTSIIGVVLFAAMLQGYVFTKAGPIQRVMLGVGGLLMFYPGWKTDLAGAIIGGIVILLQFSTRRKMKRKLA